jgi:hypothetical protein
MSTPVWLRAVMVREGDDVVTRCCVVAGGEFFPIEVRVNVPALIAQARSLGIEHAVQDQVGGFGSWLKKAVKKVTKSKVVKAVGSAVKKVANSPVAMIVNPGLVLAAHTTAKAATGKGLVKGKLGGAIDLGTRAVMAAAPAAAAPSALGFVSAKAALALGVGMRAVNVAKAGPAIASVAKLAQRQVALGKSAAAAIADESSDRYLANPAYVEQAVKVRANIQKLAPALAKKSVESSKVRARFAELARASRAGNAEARLATNVIAQSAKALSTIESLQAASSGGLPGLLITAQGKIVRAPRGRFLMNRARGSLTGTLYRGPKTPSLRGVFSAVSGSVSPGSVGASPGWGGALDPGNDMEGPLYDVVNPAKRVHLVDFAATVGVLTP